MKRIKLGLKLLILFAALTIPLHSVVMVKADSGWDSSYGGSSFGGSSWSTGSSWGGSSSYSWSSGGSYSNSSSNSSGSASALGGFIGILIIVIYGVIIYYSIFKNSGDRQARRDLNEKYYDYVAKYKSYNQLDNSNDISNEELQKYLPGENLEALKNKLFDVYKNVQLAWMNFDYDKLKDLCTDELATTYISQLEMLKIKKGQNIMSDWSFDGAKVTKITEDNGNVFITAIVDTRFYDYVINTETNIIMQGYKQIKVHNIYEMVYVVNKSLIEGKIKCPKCGAVITPNKTGKCEYCRTTISTTNNKIVLSKKGRLN